MKAVASGLLALGTIALAMTAFVLALMIARVVWSIVSYSGGREIKHGHGK